MAKILVINESAKEALGELKGQSKELLSYIIGKYGIGKPIDQSQLVLELNSHQFDGVVLSKQSTSPISRLFEFYRTSRWLKKGLVSVTQENKGTGKSAGSGKWKKLEAQHTALVAYVKSLIEILEAANLVYPDAPFEDETPEDVDVEETEVV
jgi:hypothetical protein